MPKFIEWDGTYTEAELVRIAELKAEADATTFLSAVVDYLGFYDDGGWIELSTEPRRRFGVRSIAHVGTYKFPVVHYGTRAREAGYGKEDQ